VNRLVHSEQIPVADIVLLSPYSKNKSCFHDGLTLNGDLTLRWDMETTSKHNTLLCSSIAAFKGLERKVVILVEADAIWGDKLWYVALSRAKELLIIFENLMKDPFLPDYPDDIM
jgi:hypothetical protein